MYNMCHKLITALLLAVTAGVANAQLADSSKGDASALRSHPAITNMATSADSLTNSVLANPGIDEQDTFGPEPMLGEPFVPSREPWLSEVMTVDGGLVGSLVAPDGILVQRAILFHNLDLLLQANTPSPPVYFGVDSEVKFVEAHNYQPGIPMPVGMSYPMGQKRWTLFTEFAPIFNADPSTSLGWGGGIGIRFYFGR
jgi:hypothetical protein